MATLDLRSTGGKLRLSRNSGAASVRSFMVVGPKGADGLQGPPGPVVTVAAGSVTLADNGDGTVTLTATTGGAVTDNNDGTATIAG